MKPIHIRRTHAYTHTEYTHTHTKTHTTPMVIIAVHTQPHTRTHARTNQIRAAAAFPPTSPTLLHAQRLCTHAHRYVLAWDHRKHRLIHARCRIVAPVPCMSSTSRARYVNAPSPRTRLLVVCTSCACVCVCVRECRLLRVCTSSDTML